MAKAAGAACNMRCRYCYYTEKADVLPIDGRGLMSEATLERYIRDYLHAQTAPTAQFVWHGGEPLLRPLSFYRRAMDLQRARRTRLRDRQRVADQRLAPYRRVV